MAAAIRVEDLTKLYGRRRGVLELSFDVRRGEIFGFLGPNGAGKSTTIRILLDLIRPTSGRAEVLGLDSRRDADAVHRRVGYVPGEPALYPRLTARELVDFFGHVRGVSDASYALEVASRLEVELDRPVRTLSRGNKQKVALLQALAFRPELLILDEPSTGLDPLVQQVFHELVREAAGDGRTVFLSSHVLSEVEHLADRVAIVREGRLVAVEAIEALRERAVRELVVRFAHDVPVDELTAMQGVRDVVADGHVARLRVDGSLDALIKQLARHEVIDLTSHEPDLEEIFLSYYAGADAA